MQSSPHRSTSHHGSHSYAGAVAGSVRRKPSSGHVAYEEGIHAGPWEQMTQTYSWVIEQEFLHRRKLSRRPTEDWVFPQQNYQPEEDVMSARGYTPSRTSSTRRDVPPRRKTWEEAVYRYEIDADRWMRHEEETRRLAEERQQAKARIREEIRRIDERIQQRRAEEKRMLEESRARAFASSRERERRGLKRTDRGIVDSWERYEARWSELATSTEALNFKNIPWPMVSLPRGIEDITPSEISAFLFSPMHSQSVSFKERIRSAQLRWHPDRFRRLINRVEEGEKAIVEESVGIIARCLNDMMDHEKSR